MSFRVRITLIAAAAVAIAIALAALVTYNTTRTKRAWKRRCGATPTTITDP